MKKRVLDHVVSLRTILLVIVLLCWLLPTLVLGSFMGTRFFSSLREKTEAALITGAEHAQVLTLQRIDHVVTLAKDVVYDGEISSSVAAYESGKEAYEVYFRTARNYLERKYSREALCDFAIFFRMAQPEQLLFNTMGYNEAMFFQREVQQDVLALSDTLDTRCIFYAAGERTYLIRNLFNTRMECYGMLVLGIDMQELLAPITASAQRWNSAFAVRLDDRACGDLSNAQAPIGLSESGELLVYTQDVAAYDYHFFYQVQTDKNTVYAEMHAFQGLMIGMFALLAPICLLIMLFVHKRILRPIALLNDASLRIEHGELGVTVPMQGQDEMGQLGRAFSEMSLRLQTLIEKSYKEELALKDAQIQAMQSRINPHFLNNAMETINWQARMEGSETISAMVEALSLLLNGSMARDEEHLAPLAEELQMADAYFYFISLRFGENLTLWKDVGEGTLAVPVPRLAIQTLLENAVEHGIAPAGGGRIHLNVFLRENLLHVEVINNGRRLSAEELQGIAKLLDEDAEASAHLGLRNVSRRLKLLYGRAAGLTLTQNAHGETVAAFYIPTTPQAKTTNATLN